jgi:hypothetical protein
MLVLLGCYGALCASVHTIKSDASPMGRGVELLFDEGKIKGGVNSAALGGTAGMIGPPQGGQRVGRGFAAPSAKECTMNRAPTLVRPAANDDIETPHAYGVLYRAFTNRLKGWSRMKESLKQSNAPEASLYVPTHPALLGPDSQ